MNIFKKNLRNRIPEQGQAMTEFAIMLPFFLILAFASLGLARLVYVRWALEERSRFAAFSRAKGAEGDSLFNDHLKHRPSKSAYMSNVSFSSSTTVVGDLVSLLNTPNIKQPRSSDPIPSAVLSARQSTRSQAHLATKSAYWRSVYNSQIKAPAAMVRSFQQLDADMNHQLSPMQRSNPYIGSRSALRKIDRAMAILHRNARASAATVLDQDKLFQSQYLTSIMNDDPFVRDNFSLNKTVAPKRSFPGAFQGVMRNVLATDSSLIDSEIDNSVFHSRVSVAGIGTSLSSLPLHGIALKDLTSDLYIVADSWDINRQNGNNWRSLGNQESTYHDSDEEGVLRRRTIGLWMLPSNPVALLEPMTALFPHQLQGTVRTMNGPVSRGITTIKEFFGSDNPLNRLLRAIHHLPVIGSITDIELPEWPAVRPQAYPGSVEMKGDKLSGKRRNFKHYVIEQRAVLGRER